MWVSMFVCGHRFLGVHGNYKYLCLHECASGTCTYRLHNGLNLVYLYRLGGAMLICGWHAGARPMCTCVCRLLCPTDRREELRSLQRRYPGMGLWEEGKGVCCLYPISPPDSTGPIPPGGARCRCGFGGLRPRPGSWAAGWGRGAGLRGPCSPSWCHPTHLPLPAPTHHPPAWTDQPHKALFMPGGWLGASEGGWGRRGGSRTHGQGTSGSIRGRPRRHPPWGWIQ